MCGVESALMKVECWCTVQCSGNSVSSWERGNCARRALLYADVHTMWRLCCALFGSILPALFGDVFRALFVTVCCLNDLDCQSITLTDCCCLKNCIFLAACLLGGLMVIVIFILSCLCVHKVHATCMFQLVVDPHVYSDDLGRVERLFTLLTIS